MIPAFVPLKILRYGFRKKYPAERFIPKQQDLKKSYDVVIIGGGGHALACAYYLAHTHGITNVCILERGYLAGGNTARNTAIIRSNYLTPEGVRFYEQSLNLYRDFSQELDFNILYSERGDDDFSWSLVEPTTVALKAAPTPVVPPSPAAFQLPPTVKFREASTKPGGGVYEGVWTRRGTSNIYDGAWTYLPTGQKYVDVLEVRGVENGKLIVFRQGNKGTYTIPVANGKTGRGTASWVSDPAFYVEFFN